MFKKILIMVDNSPIMEDVLEYVTTLFPDAYYCLYSVVNLGQFSGYYTKVVLEQMQQMSSATLTRLQSVMEEKRIKSSVFLDEGDPVSSALLFARKNGVDLFVIEAHSGVFVNKIKLGGTVASLLEHAHIPIFLLSEELVPAKSPRLLHPTTGSKYSEKATHLAAELAREWQATLTTCIFEDSRETTKKRAEEIYASAGVTSEWFFPEGDQVHSINAFAQKNDIIIGSRGGPGPGYKLRFFFPALALDPTVRLTVAFLPKPMLLVCD
jgi:nucleotide-binding universal stress UspA family protein